MKFKPGRGAPVAEQPRLDVLDLQRLAQERIRIQIDLADGKIVGRTPIGVDLAEFFCAKNLVGNSGSHAIGGSNIGGHKIIS